MKVVHSRSGRQLTLATAAMLFGSGRDGVEEAFPGDIIGLNNPVRARGPVARFALRSALLHSNHI